VRVDKYGRKTGGKPLARGALYLMLQNRIYLGEIVHKENSYPGEHDAIIDKALWEEVQRKLAANRVDRANGTDVTQPSLLAGLIYDDAGDLEALVEDRLRQFLMSEAEMFKAIESQVADVKECQGLFVRAADLAERWPGLAPSDRRAVLSTLVDRIELLRETLEIRILPGRLSTILGEEDNRRDRARVKVNDERSITLSIAARLRRTGMETRLLIDGAGGGTHRKPGHSLCRVLALAHRYHAMVMRNGGKTMAELASETGVGGSYFTRILHLSFLAPDVVTAILRDRHPVELTAKRLANGVRLPKAWEEQRTLRGIDGIQN